MNQATHPKILRRIRIYLAIVVFGLFVSGVTAIPLVWEADILHRIVNKSPIFTAEENRAWLKTQQVQAERALQTGSGAAGGFALPIVIDPSILLTSSGALNPIREKASAVMRPCANMRKTAPSTPIRFVEAMPRST